MARIARVAMVAAVLVLFAASGAQGANPDLLVNGSFEDGFVNGVGKGWTAFNNGGHCTYTYVADTWKPMVWDGQSSQLITIASDGSEKDRYAGIYQTVAVTPGATYRLTLHGMVRSSEGSSSASGYGYRMQWAIDYSGGADWQKVDPAAWQELDWYEWPLLSPGYLETFTVDVKATSPRLTLFVRGWKKWSTPHQEADYNLDAISLAGAAPAPQPTVPPQGQLPPTGAGPLVPVLVALLLAVLLAAVGLRAYRFRR